MERQPVPLRKVPLIAKWSPEDLARLLTRDFEGRSYILTAYEWVEGCAARTVSPSTLQEMLAGLDTAPDTYSKIAQFPTHFFVWLDELEAAYQTYHYYASLPDGLDPHDAFDMDPATYPYDDLLSDCPDFTSNPNLIGGAPQTRQDLNKQKTRGMYARWQARAVELKEINPHMTAVSIAIHIAKEAVGEKKASDTIRKNITI